MHISRINFFAAATIFLGSVCTPSAPAQLAPTPPMGWNSWDVFGPSVREPEVKANADFMSAKLASHGWRYIIVDIEWYAPDAHAQGYIPGGRVVLDPHGRFVPSPNRFPDAVNGAGFKPLADYVHSKNLKFCIHIMRGIPREAVARNLPIEGSKYHAADIADKVNICKWKGMEDTFGVDMSKSGAQDYYDSVARLYAQWGLDYIKADDMSRPFHKAEIHAFSVALKKTGRPIVLSLSPGPAPVAAYDDLKADAQAWRISDDFRDRWVDVKEQFDLTAAWQGKSYPGGWPDADMLPLGHIGIRAERGVDRASLLTRDEQMTLMSLWSIFRSPLMFGGDLGQAMPLQSACSRTMRFSRSIKKAPMGASPIGKTLSSPGRPPARMGKASTSPSSTRGTRRKMWICPSSLLAYLRGSPRCAISGRDSLWVTRIA